MKKKLLNGYIYPIGFVVIVTLIIITYFPFSFLISKHLVLKEAETKGNIDIIKSVTYSHIGRPYTIVTGTDSNGRDKMIWFDLVNKTFHPSIVYSIYVDDGITKENAIKILKEKCNIKEYKQIELAYLKSNSFYENLDYSKPIAEGVYWRIVINENSHVYIDFKTGKPYKTRFE